MVERTEWLWLDVFCRGWESAAGATSLSKVLNQRMPPSYLQNMSYH
jgi:hypothetical protein